MSITIYRWVKEANSLYDNFQSWVAAQGSTNASVAIGQDIILTDDLIIPPNIDLVDFYNGAKFSGPHVLSIGSMSAKPRHQIFISGVNVTFSGISVDYISPTWFGSGNGNLFIGSGMHTPASKLVIDGGLSVGANIAAGSGNLYVNGSGAFNGIVSGSTPVSNNHLTTKLYVDTISGQLDARINATGLYATNVSGQLNTYITNTSGQLSARITASALSGTTNNIAKFTSTSGIGNSIMSDTGGSITITSDNPQIGLKDNASSVYCGLNGTTTDGSLTIFADSSVDPNSAAEIKFIVGSYQKAVLKSGNLGIGTTTPSGTLTVGQGGDILLTCSGYNYGRIYNAEPIGIDNGEGLYAPGNGLIISGVSQSDGCSSSVSPGLTLIGQMRVSDPIDEDSAVSIIGIKSTGALGDAETVLSIKNNGTTIASFLGKGTLNLSGTSNIDMFRLSGLRRTYSLGIGGSHDYNFILSCDGNQTGFAVSADGDITANGLTIKNNALIQGDIYSNAWSDYAGDSTISGWSSPTAYIYTQKLGRTVNVIFRIYGTSNADGVSFTLPYTNNSTVGITNACYTLDNIPTTGGYVSLPAGGTKVSVYPTPLDDTWETSGNKYVYGQFIYFTN